MSPLGTLAPCRRESCPIPHCSRILLVSVRVLCGSLSSILNFFALLAFLAIGCQPFPTTRTALQTPQHYIFLPAHTPPAKAFFPVSFLPASNPESNQPSKSSRPWDSVSAPPPVQHPAES